MARDGGGGVRRKGHGTSRAFVGKHETKTAHSVHSEREGGLVVRKKWRTTKPSLKPGFEAPRRRQSGRMQEETRGTPPEGDCRIGACGGGVCIKLSCKWGVEHVKCMQG